MLEGQWQEAPLPPTPTACSGSKRHNVGRQACGVLRRDVKPENIVLEGGTAGGRVFLVDFGGVQVRSLRRS